VSSREIQTDIAETRRNMDETLERLGERLHPRTLFDDVIDFFRGDEEHPGVRERAKHAGQRIADSFKSHPTSALLIGAGIAMSFFEDRRESKKKRLRSAELREYSGSFVDARTGEPYDETYGQEWRRETEGEPQSEGPSLGEKARDLGERAKERGRSMARRGKEAAGRIGSAFRSAKSSVQGAGSRAGERVHGLAEGTRERTRAVGDQIHRAYDSGRHQVQGAFEEHPLSVGLGSFAIGLALGLMIPESRREKEVMGEKAERVRQRMRDVGADVMERSKAVASEAAEAASEAVERQGLTPERDEGQSGQSESRPEREPIVERTGPAFEPAGAPHRIAGYGEESSTSFERIDPERREGT